MSAHRIPADLSKSEFQKSDPGTAQALPYEIWGQVIGLVIGAGAETNTLSNPTSAGQELVLTAISVGGGSRAVTAAGAINQAANTIMTFGAARDTIVLRSIPIAAGAFRWQVAANDGVALS